VKRASLGGHTTSPRWRGAPRRGLDAVGLEYSCYRAWRHLMPEVKQLTSDALVAPSWIVGRHRHDQRSELVGGRRSSGVAVRIASVPGDEATVPVKEGLGSYSERRPALARREPAHRCEPDPIGSLEAEQQLPAAQDLELVAQHQDLDLRGPATPEEKHHEREHAANGKVGEHDS